MVCDIEVAALRALIDGLSDTAPAPDFAVILASGIARLSARRPDAPTAGRVSTFPKLMRGAPRRRRPWLARPRRPLVLLRSAQRRMKEPAEVGASPL